MNIFVNFEVGCVSDLKNHKVVVNYDYLQMEIIAGVERQNRNLNINIIYKSDTKITQRCGERRERERERRGQRQ